MDEVATIPRPASTLTRLFMVQYNLILVGGAALFALASASLTPLLAAAAGEVIWLGLGPISPGVRRWLDRRDAAMQRNEHSSDSTAPNEALDTEHTRRVASLERVLADIRELGRRRPSAAFDRAVQRLVALRSLYVGLCETHQRIERFLATTNDAELAAEAERLRAAFSAEKDLGIRLTLKQALGSAQRRVEHRKSMTQLIRGIAVKLESVDRSMTYLRSQGPALTANPRFHEDVEALLAEVGPAISVELESGEAARFG
jgi:hypothetical protein